MTTYITSDREYRITVELQTEYWGGDFPNLISGEAIRVDAYDDDALITLTALEARSLAAALIAAAAKLESKAKAAA